MTPKKIKERETGKIGKSTVVERDLRHKEWDRIIENKNSEFKHTAKMGEIEHGIICPECNEEHILKIRPIIRKYNINSRKQSN